MLGDNRKCSSTGGWAKLQKKVERINSERIFLTGGRKTVVTI